MININMHTTAKAFVLAFSLTALPLAVSPVLAHTTTTLGVNDNPVNIKANLKMARKLMAKSGSSGQISRNYNSAQKYIEEVLEVDPENSEAQELLAKYYTYRAERRKANKKYEDAMDDIRKAYELNPTEENVMLFNEISEAFEEQEEAWTAACADGSSSALEAFQKKYPKSNHVDEIAGRKGDNEAWQTACSTNTVDAYKQYLVKSEYLFHKDEANERVRKLQMEEDWTAVKDTKDHAQLDAFAEKYPGSDYAAEAINKSTLLQAHEKYAAGQYSAAVKLYNKAKKYKPLEGKDLEDYTYVEAKIENMYILALQDSKAVATYLDSLKNAPVTYPEFYDTASDHYALLLAKKLNHFSSDSEMDTPARYAKNENTRQEVESYVNNAKSARRTYRRKMWWRHNCRPGILLDFDLNPTKDGSIKAAELQNFSAGLGVRFGANDDFVNGVFGVKYKQFAYKIISFGDDDESEYENLCSAVAIPVELRFNVVNWGESASFFIGCGAEYGFIISSDVQDDYAKKNYFSVNPLIGMRFRNFDFSFYYKTVLGGLSKKSDVYAFPEYKTLVGLNLQFWF